MVADFCSLFAAFQRPQIRGEKEACNPDHEAACSHPILMLRRGVSWFIKKANK